MLPTPARPGIRTSSRVRSSQPQPDMVAGQFKMTTTSHIPTEYVIFQISSSLPPSAMHQAFHSFHLTWLGVAGPSSRPSACTATFGREIRIAPPFLAGTNLRRHSYDALLSNLDKQRVWGSQSGNIHAVQAKARFGITDGARSQQHTWTPSRMREAGGRLTTACRRTSFLVSWCVSTLARRGTHSYLPGPNRTQKGGIEARYVPLCRLYFPRPLFLHLSFPPTSAFPSCRSPKRLVYHSLCRF